MKPSRMTKLERQVRSRPCPGCGRAFDRSSARNDEADFERLTGHEQAELAALIQATLTPPCRRCRRSGYTLTGLSDEQLGRTLRLLRTLLGTEFPASAVVDSTHISEDALKRPQIRLYLRIPRNPHSPITRRLTRASAGNSQHPTV